MPSPLSVGSAIGGVACVLLAISPVPANKFALLRTVAAGGGAAIFAAGYLAAKADEKHQAEIAIELAKVKEQEKFDEEQALRDRLAIAESQREVLVIEAKQREAARVEVALADYTDDVRDAYIAVQDGKGRLDRVLDRISPPPVEQIPLPEAKAEVIVESAEKKESHAAKKAKLLKLLREHEGGWIAKCLKKPLLIYGSQGSGKSYFAEFIALCRYYLRDHQIVSIADPHFHQNKDECWKYLIKLKVPGFGANHNYKEVNSQLLAMYDSFAVRTLKSPPQTRIFDEITRYKEEEDTKEAAAKLGSKLSSDVRKANCSPIVVAHGTTLAILGGADGFAEAINENFVKVKLNSNDEQEPLWGGMISGIKDDDGETISNMKISIASDWIRSSWVYDLFNSEDAEEQAPVLSRAETSGKPESKPEPLDSAKFNRMMKDSDRYLDELTPEILQELRQKWLLEVNSSEVEVTSSTTPWDEVLEVPSEVPEVRNSSTSGVTSLLPENVRSEALAQILALLSEAGSTSSEVLGLIQANPDKAVWIGIKILGISMTAVSRDIFKMGSGGGKFKQAKIWYESLEKAFGDN